MPSFNTIPLRSELQTALQRLGFNVMTPIQSESLPLILQDSDIIAKAATGSGKTLAFALGILQPINPKFFSPQSLILCPTRELAEQVAKVIRSLASEIGNVKLLTLCGGVPMKGQIRSLSHGAHIIVGTPGRVLRLLQLEELDLSHAKTCVLDEADRMVDMGFVEDIEAVCSHLPSKRQTLLFSATYPDTIETLASTLTSKALMVDVASEHSAPPIQEIAYSVHDKMTALKTLIQEHHISNAILFCNTKVTATELCERLNEHGIHAVLFHGEMEQLDRHETIIQFRNGSAPFLVATDLAGRGIDIEALGVIINYDLPQHSERYVHRIGRTGRAGNEGIAITLIEPFQKDALDALGRPFRFPELEDTVTDISFPSASMRTICIDGGKKEKLRPGDIVGALIHECGMHNSQIGKIDQLEHLSYVALPRPVAEQIYDKLIKRPIKGKVFRLWLLD